MPRVLMLAVCWGGLSAAGQTGFLAGPATAPVGNVIFVHPDGAGVAHWTAARIFLKGPDGLLHWDRIPHLAVYRGHMKDALAATSHGGATTHAFGVKVGANSFGMDRGAPLRALSGFEGSIMREAQAAGLAVGIVNSGNLDEPGTACFLASVASRRNGAEIVRQLVESGAEVILGGGEKWMLPEGRQGAHGRGARADNLDIYARAAELGYTIVRTRAELLSVPDDTVKLLGVFAHDHTFNDRTEEDLRAAGLEPYDPAAPDVATMMTAALQILSRGGRRFLLVVEEEGTDNLANYNNAAGTLEALRRADAALAVGRDFVQGRTDTLLLTAADSDASGMQVIAPGPDVRRPFIPGEPLPPTTGNGAPLDGHAGTATAPFLSAPDAAGAVWPFGIAWTGLEDGSGGILLRAEGLNAERLQLNADNTEVYRLMYLTLFGRWPDRRDSEQVGLEVRR
jgi:alkaline phosphatase